MNAPAPHRFTWSDFVDLDEDDRRELIDGELVETEVPTALHEHIVTLLVFFLAGWARPRRAGVVLVSGYKIRVNERRGVMPDVQFYRAENASIVKTKALESGRPDLVVEVISETSARYDRVTKLGYYVALGVPEYWIVDPAARTLWQLTLADGKYVITTALADDDAFRPASFDGLEIPLGELWTIPGVDAPVH